MEKINFPKWVLLFVLLLSINTMNAQNKENLVLNAQQESIVKISALTAVGNLEDLKIQLNKGLDAGLSINEINETLVQLYAYCGFPRSLNAINAFMTVVEDRKSKGIKDLKGKEAGPIKSNLDRYERGRKTLEELTKVPQTKPAPGFGEFAPRADAFLKEHLFADIFDNDVLNFQQRELVTIAALSAMQGVESQLKSHVGMGKNTGITDEQLKEVADLIEKNIDRTQANILRNMIAVPTVPVIERDMIVRMSEIDILPEYLDEYKKILKEEASASVHVEPGVIAIFPMYQIKNPTQVRIIEIYANNAAYQAHLKTPHFLFYKTETLKMVKDLKLVDMDNIDHETMIEIFKKLK
ncbi:carboxymuconolactone decarboxylase family protein [Flavobacterium hiemivividum]|uniref:carboxymuconolactone decarboxylase family protein n=1 Tax=Flavobacterium hiemivividum TaxID=2541734 RepID=UPI001FB6FD16|nr:carboxymuconolactone decarboxylase family protein [Flavobacterium hiemivividum]